ncbi:recombination mediator RecR [Acidiferrobacter thiooxydans]|uniref:Recombination protein RecR n=1 Tax=Acidiferrobacter thiooxydans TaxID=163359 RepID=A0A1C2G4K4_9GAMM|nr:recombination mediator RecR [Acidiferrobacter thiooxydans]MDA8190540.1 recombination mediator RecR [Gammaproteobacteria bacterium]RCN59196.1 recombination protein RecR [Acidiferrobacter thiooxydans]UEO00926.1 recombination mediator RecR [Acidiferrobacter thiooxydans]
MSNDTKALEDLKRALRRLPGIGTKSAQRMAFHLLGRDRSVARDIAEALLRAVDRIGHCQQCNNFSETEICAICRSPRRDSGLLCVVESPADLVSLEQSGAFGGTYFVLMGRLSPLDGIGPEELGLPKLEALLDGGVVREVILATNATVEGEATAHYIGELARRRNLLATRIACGVPIGGEIEYIDRGTLARAFSGRREA